MNTRLLHTGALNGGIFQTEEMINHLRRTVRRKWRNSEAARLNSDTPHLYGARRNRELGNAALPHRLKLIKELDDPVWRIN